MEDIKHEITKTYDIAFLKNMSFRVVLSIRDKVFKNRPYKVCRRQSLKTLK